MGKLKFDLSFERDGRTLADWLQGLVCDDRERRMAAGEALGAMWQGIPAYSSKWDDLDTSEGFPDLGVHSNRFKQAVRDAVEQPEFPKALFVRRLMLFQMMLQDDNAARLKRTTWHDPHYDQLETKLIEQSLTSPDEAERTKAGKRFAKFFCASVARDNKVTTGGESSKSSGFLSFLVMSSLDTAFLAARDVLEEMLTRRGTRHLAVQAIERMGAGGRVLAPLLLKELASLKPNEQYYAAAALGAIGRDDPETIAQLLEFVRNSAATQCNAALSVLAEMGPALAGRTNEAIELLLSRWNRPSDERWAVLRALASVGRSDERALAIVLEQAKSRPPVMKLIEGRYPYDEAMHERGFAISALGHFGAFADRVVPVLVDAFETFEEFDPDWGYSNGTHGRVIDALSKMGPAAATAVPVMVRHLRSEEGEFEWPIIKLLGKLGPRASEALPALRAMNAELLAEVESPTSDPSSPNETNDPLPWAIWRIEGRDLSHE